MTNTYNGTQPESKTRKPYPDGRRSMTRLETIAMAKLLDEHLVYGDDGYWEYKDGWSDRAVANAVNNELASYQVAKLRIEIKGKIRTGSGGGFINSAKMAEFIQRLDKLSEENNALMDATMRLTKDYGALFKVAEELRRRHFLLCQNLSANRIVDVTHLKGNDVPLDEALKVSPTQK